LIIVNWLIPYLFMGLPCWVPWLILYGIGWFNNRPSITQLAVKWLGFVGIGLLVISLWQYDFALLAGTINCALVPFDLGPFHFTFLDIYFLFWGSIFLGTIVTGLGIASRNRHWPKIYTRSFLLLGAFSLVLGFCCGYAVATLPPTGVGLSTGDYLYLLTVGNEEIKVHWREYAISCFLTLATGICMTLIGVWQSEKR